MKPIHLKYLDIFWLVSLLLKVVFFNSSAAVGYLCLLSSVYLGIIFCSSFLLSYQKQPPEVFCKKSVLRNFIKFTEKHLRNSQLFIKVVGLGYKQRLWHRCFPVNFVKFLRTPFLQKTSGRLPLIYAFQINNSRC